MADILSLDATAQLQALEAKRISAAELLDLAVARWRGQHARINAVVATDIDRARIQARAIDETRAKGGTLGALAGLPMTVKDTLDAEGLAASSGLEPLRRRGSVRDAAAVARARQEGAVIWGKTNVPVMAADWQSYNALYGTTNNPWDVERTTGGSSGGAAAALATGVTALEIGSDIGGSLRVPASFCGVFSHKPTWGLVSQRGHIPPAPGTLSERDLNVVGPMARSARDLRLLLSVLEEGPLAARAPAPAVKTLRIGLWLDEPSFPLDPQVREAVQGFAQHLGQRGATVEPVRPVDGAVVMDAYRVLLASALAADLPPAMIRSMRRLRGAAGLARRFGAGPTSWAAQVLGYTASHAEWLAADEARARIAAQVKPLFERFDVILAPIAPVVAFPHDHRPFNRRTLVQSDGQRIPYPSMLNWISLATACGLPATAVPAGLSTSGLPVGVQLIGPRGGDARTLAAAQAIEAEIGGFLAPPPPAA
ncbi:MAG: amidase family protein [Caulobacteraceae bacterium]|nr:amidase family protein [Caulobacteraceae bacterium]